MDFQALAQQCAPDVHASTMAAIVRTESSFNPFAIGVVNGSLARQPRNEAEAIATAKNLHANGYNYSVGLAQVNKTNFRHYGLTIETAFQPCANLRAGSQILKACFVTAKGKYSNDQQALRGAFSCYYSGNFSTGFHPDFKGQPSYVQKIVGNAIGISASKAEVPIPVYRSATSKAKAEAKAKAKRSEPVGAAKTIEAKAEPDKKNALVF